MDSIVKVHYRRISKLKEGSTEINQSEQEKDSRVKKVNGTSGTCGTIAKISQSCHLSPREEKEWTEKFFK